MNAGEKLKPQIREIGHFIGGKHVAGKSGRFGEVFNPTLGAQTGKVALAATPAFVRAGTGKAYLIAKNPAASSNRVTRPIFKALTFIGKFPR